MTVEKIASIFLIRFDRLIDWRSLTMNTNAPLWMPNATIGLFKKQIMGPKFEAHECQFWIVPFEIFPPVAYGAPAYISASI